jgi:DNA-binding FrmR family transcriptional regulator
MREVYWDPDDMILRLKRVEGQVRGVQAMVQRNESCRDILVQVAAVEGAIHQIERIIQACSVVEAMTHLMGVPEDLGKVRTALQGLVR